MGKFEWTDYVPTEKDLLLGRLRRGEIELQDAEEAAKQGGFGPLERQPDASAFNPLHKAYWTLPMAMAWIIWRDVNRVREWDNEYRAECWDLLWREYVLPPEGDERPRVEAGYHLEQRRPANALIFTISFAVGEQHGERFFLTPNEAKKQLWQYLQEEKLVATAAAILTDGIACADGALVRGMKGALSARPTDIIELPCHEWAHLDWWADIHGEECLDIVGPMFGVKRYQRVRLKRDDLLRCWPRGLSGYRRGAKPKFDWDLLQAETLKHMDHHGAFVSCDPEWNAQARLEEVLKKFCQERWQCEPANGTLRPKLAEWLKSWEADKRVVGN